MARNLFDVRQAADRLGLRAADVRRLVESGQIPYLTVGPFLRFDPAELEAWRSPGTRGMITVIDAPAVSLPKLDDTVIDVEREERDRTAVAD